MSAESHYCALPYDDELIQLALSGEIVANRAIFSLIFNGDVYRDEWTKSSHPWYQLAVDFLNRYPKIGQLRFDGGKSHPECLAARLHYRCEVKDRSWYEGVWFEQSFERRFLWCDEQVDPSSPGGHGLRYSPPQVVLEVAQGIALVDLASLEDESLREHCLGLAQLYEQTASYGGLSIFLWRE